MYRTCIFCSGDLGANEAVEEFPVGSRLAFDAWKGRLWAVCRKCSRWNLAPLEERWEAVESAEKLFRDARLRMQSENIGLARLPDGTSLIRVGEALPGELAAWRYGDHLLQRWRKQRIREWGLVFAMVPLGLSSIMFPPAAFPYLFWAQRRLNRAVYRLPAEQSPTGEALLVRRNRLIRGVRLTADSDGEPTLVIPERRDVRFWDLLTSLSRKINDPIGRLEPSITLRGSSARAVLGRMMVATNEDGASRSDLDEALGLLERAGGAEGFLRRTARHGAKLGMIGIVDHLLDFTPEPEFETREEAEKRKRERAERFDVNTLSRPKLVAFEMALHEESERRALEGELALLKAAWREAEEIAQIADALPDDPLEQLKR